MVLPILARRHSVLLSVLPKMLFFALWSLLIYILYAVLHWPISMDDKLTPMLSVSIALLLAFRTNRAFERYSYGAQQWTTLTAQIRNLSRICWNGIIVSSPDIETEKMALMRLLYVIALATKYTLRSQDAFDRSDVRALLPKHMALSLKKTGQLGRSAIISYKSSLINLLDVQTKTITTTMISSNPAQQDPILMKAVHSPTDFMAQNKSRQESESPVLDPSSLESDQLLSIPETNTQSQRNSICVPLTRTSTRNATFDVIHRVSYCLRRHRHMGTLDLEDVPSANKAIETIIDSLTKFEQLVIIPVPKSYAAHIEQVLALYFFAMPFQLVKPLGLHIIWVIMVVSFAFFGAETIADEIEDPFGNDKDDLPIDDFCEQLKQDIEYIMEKPGALSIVNETNHLTSKSTDVSENKKNN